MIETIRVVETDRDLLARLKRSTGIKNWNILCRWAFVLSLADDNQTSVDPIGNWSNVEMTWKVFGSTCRYLLGASGPACTRGWLSQRGVDF